MNDTTKSDSAKPGRRKTLTLRGTLEGATKPAILAGARPSGVVVETRKRRIPGAPQSSVSEAHPRTKPSNTALVVEKKSPLKRASKRAEAEAAADQVNGNALSEGERAARERALAEALVSQAEETKQKQEQEQERQQLEHPQPPKEKPALETEPAKVDPLALVVSPEEAIMPEIEKTESRKGLAVKRSKRPDFEEKEAEQESHVKLGKSLRHDVKPQPRRDLNERRRGKLTITNALNDDEELERSRSLAALRRRREKEKARQREQPRTKISREVILPETITVQELAARMAERGFEVVKMLEKAEQTVGLNDTIDADTAELIIHEFGHTVHRVAESDIEFGVFDTENDTTDTKPRAPIVTIMGHVDHGKTTLLDVLRKSNVAGGEAGGITQHIGAYQVEVAKQKITFIDTPGHEAFSNMRLRGAKVTDIVILVVAADDGVKPQTIEAINHAKAAEVPIIVAINKIDKPGADSKRVRTELMQHEVFVESMGGEILDVEVSALKNQNLDKLLESVLLQAELMELKANPDRAASGVVIESKIEKGKGTVATLLVRNGTLEVGNIAVAGSHWGRVRALFDHNTKATKKAIPSQPVELLGLDGPPEAGEPFGVVENEARARDITEYRQRLTTERQQTAQPRASLEMFMNQLNSETAEAQEFPLIIKGDVQGSVEAIASSLEKLGTEEVKVRIAHSGVGGITESDVALAATSQAVILGFNTRVNKQAREAVEKNGVEIRYYNIIYDLLDDIKAAMSGLLAPEVRETFIGNAEILEVFSVSKTGKVAGCRIIEGNVERGAKVRLIRDGVVIHEGKLKTLKRFKDEVSEVNAGQECGMGFENYQDLHPGDVIECFRVEEIKRSL